MYLQMCLILSEICSDKYLRVHFSLLKYCVYFTLYKYLGFSPNVHVGGLDESICDLGSQSQDQPRAEYLTLIENVHNDRKIGQKAQSIFQN